MKKHKLKFVSDVLLSNGDNYYNLFSVNNVFIISSPNLLFKGFVLF